jgi:undecaprenyl-phosphate 4-deoxy-4-formamido-L-arabinose transferase
MAAVSSESSFLDRVQSPVSPTLDISVIIPNWNEEEILEHCLTEVRKVLKETGRSYEIIFVDDGSTDGSVAKLASFVNGAGDVTVLKLKRNFGQQKAILAGLGVARGRVLIPYDPDLQFAPECIPTLAQKIFDGYDIAGGIRTSRQDPLRTRMLSWFGSFMINRALSRSVQDFGAVKAYSRRIIDDILRLPTDYLIIPAAAIALTRNVIEFPVRHQARQVGVSKWTFLMRLELCLDVYVSYAQRPFEWMMIGGFFSLFLSFLVGLCIAAYWLFITHDFRGTIYFFDIFLFFTGVHFLALSLVGEFVVRLFRRKFQVSDRFDLHDLMIEKTWRDQSPTPATSPAVSEVVKSELPDAVPAVAARAE